MIRPASTTRAVLTLLLGVVLLAGLLEFHSEHSLSHAPVLQGGMVAKVCHPKEALHIEASEMVSVPACPACLLHLKSSARDQGPIRGLAEPTPDGRPPRTVARRLSALWHLPGPSRAPPRA